MAVETTAAKPRDFLEEAWESKAPPPRPKVYFGKMRIDYWDGVLVPGKGKVPFNKNEHSEDDKVHVLKLSLDTLPSAPQQFTTEREIIAESPDFDKHLRPSLAAINRRLHELRDAYCQVELVPSRKYKNAAGEEKQATAFVVKAIYPSEAACEAAAAEVFKKHGAPAASGEAPAAPAKPATVEMTPEQRATALETMYRTMGGDADRFMALLANMPPFAGLTREDPEIDAIIRKPF